MYVTEWLNCLSDVRDGLAAMPTNYYIGLFSGDYTPVLTETGATIATSATELLTEYDEATRVLYVPGAGGAVAGVNSNTASKAVFTFNATVDVWGCFVIADDDVKGGTTGVLVRVDRFPTMRSYDALSVLNLTIENIIAN